MKFLKYAIATTLFVVAAAANEMSAKGKMAPRVYMYGFSASFNDSIVFFTDVVTLDSAWMDTKTKFLLGRNNYAMQLKNYLAEKKSMPNRTCVVMFGTKRNKVEEDFMKMKRLYTEKAKKGYDVRNVPSTDFTFTPIDMSEEEEAKTERAEKTKKAKKNKRPDMKGKKPDGGMMPPPGNGQMPPQM